MTYDIEITTECDNGEKLNIYAKDLTEAQLNNVLRDGWQQFLEDIRDGTT